MANATPKQHPLSPHLQIWRFTPTMAASITHRGTGVALYVGTMLLALWALATATGANLFAPVTAILASPIGGLVFFLYTWALVFHIFGGLRYLYYDSGRGLAPKTATTMAIANFVIAFVVAGLIIIFR